MNHTVYPALVKARRRNESRRSICAGYAAYEHRKSEWAAQNPDASPAEHQTAMQRIARECGV
jgi:hypothetical protein